MKTLPSQRDAQWFLADSVGPHSTQAGPGLSVAGPYSAQHQPLLESLYSDPHELSDLTVSLFPSSQPSDLTS